MCGIFCAVNVDDAADVVLTGLKRLEYRGYDSWGIATLSREKILTQKAVGKIGDVTSVNLPNSMIAIGHTRWATTGGVTQKNAHPHVAADSSFALIHNGIVENFQELKHELLQGDAFISQTDTEVIVKFIEKARASKNSLFDAICRTTSQLLGRNTFVVLTSSGEIWGVRSGSPLVVGFGKNNQIYISSDTLSFAPWAKRCLVVENGQAIHIKDNDIELFNSKTGQKLTYQVENVAFTSHKVDKDGFPHFMLKEIHETPQVLEAVISQPEKELNNLADSIKSARRVFTIGSGSAGIAGRQIAYYLRSIAKIAAESLVAADALEYIPLLNSYDLLIAPSQSGETADVLEILEKVKPHGVKIASYVNMPGSAITRLSDFKFATGAGPEICVMSTKVFTSQIAWGYLLAKAVAGEYADGKKQLEQLVLTINELLNNKNTILQIKKLAKYLSGKKDIFILGKGQNTAVMYEGMVKLIEGSYLHAHAIPAGDLKHYAITLMESGVPVVVLVSTDDSKLDVLTACEEVKARSAEVIGISTEKSDIFNYFLTIPDVGETQAILNIIPLQLLAYYLSVELGNDVDKPRNIAKSVTVK
jgi:glucosamine--fructose-6-phosphate aminotransferase (isomerizing)